ncbi:DUF6378 domain-containing protein [Nocardia terpenica]|uniref:DUF6378 domain-containing protein n=1 Tax=Nocardia terpenica TaxID=455432 RepID=A0A6G9YZD0_9NOCA|nr:DUF6378 domain-containing protein [Nocardia terpenica]QIS18562.1 hypothetical protein F6W96_09920 [Nocardia terpenica]
MTSTAPMIGVTADQLRAKFEDVLAKNAHRFAEHDSTSVADLEQTLHTGAERPTPADGFAPPICTEGPTTASSGAVSASGSVLSEAAERLNGDNSEAFTRIAALWSAYLGTRVTPHDVANLVVLFHVSRVKDGYQRDSYVEIAAHAGAAERINP